MSTVESQGLTDTEKSNARANIGAQVAGSYASFTHNHDDKYQAKGSYASASHTHDDRYYTETEINTKLNGKANSSHTHTKSQITDFPTSMPASDVYSWAKASSKPSYTKSEIGLGNVDNTADANKSVKYATSAGSAPANGGTATASNYVNVNNTENKNVSRLQYFQKSGDDTIMPTKDWYSLIRCQHPGYANGYWQDIAFPFVGGGRPQVRQNVNGTKSAWKELAYKSDIPTNTGTITGIKMNGASKGTSGVVDLGTVLTGGKQSTTSTADGGSNVYTFSDGSTITVKNGSKGSTGATGKNGTNGVTPTIKVASGTAIGSVGTPSVTASTSGTTTTFTFNYLKGAKGDKGDPGTNATTTAVATTSANGLMSKDMVTKLNGIASGATAVTSTTVSNWGFKKTDTNTWRGVQNNLTSTATDQSLSAYQGKVLRDMIHRVIVQSSEPTISTNDEWLLEY